MSIKNIDSNNLNWAEKYRPQSLNDLLLTNNEITSIKKWIKDFKEKKVNIFFVYIVMMVRRENE